MSEPAHRQRVPSRSVPPLRARRDGRSWARSTAQADQRVDRYALLLFVASFLGGLLAVTAGLLL